MTGGRWNVVRVTPCDLGNSAVFRELSGDRSVFQTPSIESLPTSPHVICETVRGKRWDVLKTFAVKDVTLRMS
jgi:hypothetical protein